MVANARKRYWLVFDVGLSASYDKLFAWLDKHDAKECGDNIATFLSNKSFQTLEKDLQRILRASRGMRAYLIGKKDTSGGITGRFVFGRRKDAPWAGFGSSAISGEQDEG